MRVIVYIFLVFFSLKANCTLLQGRTFRQNERMDINLNGEWLFKRDSEQKLEKIIVPGTWNLKKFYGNEDHLELNGKFNYYKTFNYTKEKDSYPVLTIEQAFKSYKVYLNEKFVGEFKHPYLSAQFDLTDYVYEGKNELKIIVSNLINNKTLPTKSFLHGKKLGWFPYGGITGRTFITNEKCDSPWQVKIQQGNVYYNTFCNLKFRKKIITKKEGELVINDFNYKYKVKNNYVENKKIYIDNSEFKIKGMNRHADSFENGPVFDFRDAKKDIELLKDLNVNFIRSGHYPNDPRFLNLLDENNIKYVQEVPIYQWGVKQLRNKKLKMLAHDYLNRLMIRDSIRPGFVMVSLANEEAHWFKSCGKLIKSLHREVKSFDSSMLTFKAVLSYPKIATSLNIVNDRCSDSVDVIGINNYAGWYFGKTKYLRYSIDKYRQKFPKKPLFLSEFEAGSIYGKSGEVDGEENVFDHSFSEDFQDWFISQFFKIGEESGELVGYMPWVLSDFRTQWTIGTNKETLGFNLKGVTTYKKEKKKAYFRIKSFYQNK